MDKMVITIYDSLRSEWRQFNVIPYEKDYITKCSDAIHQFKNYMKVCNCGKMANLMSTTTK